MNLLGFGKEKLPSVVSNPFDKKKIIRISVTAADHWSRGMFEYYGTVEFKNGDTTGEQKFKGNSFDHVVQQIKIMIDNL